MIYGFNDDKQRIALLDLFYPVGTVYKTRNSSFDPNIAWGGTWTKIEGRFLLASSGSYPIGNTGGNANAIVPAHTHNVSGSVANDGNHTHSVSGTTGINGWHWHKNLPRGSEDYGHDFAYNIATAQYWTNNGVTRRQFQTGSSGYYAWSSKQNDLDTLWQSDRTTSDGAHNHDFSANTSQNGQHSHSFNVTSGSTGTSATGANMPPYLAVNVWTRIA